MPAYLTHRLASVEAKNKIDDENIQKIISDYEQNYYGGAQGGDFAFFRKWYFLGFHVKTKIYGGWLAHRARVGVYMKTALEYVKEHFTPSLCAYFFGYINHYCMDRYMHYEVNAETKSISYHTYIEQAVDVMYARERFGIDALTFDRGIDLDKIAKGSTNAEINAFHEYMAAAIYDGYKLTPNSYGDSMQYWAKFMHYIDEADDKKMRFIKLRNLIVQFDIVAFHYHPIEEIKDKYDFPKYFASIKRGVDKTAELIKIAYDYICDKADISDFSSMLYDISMHGAPVLPMEDRAAFKKNFIKLKTV